MDNAFGALCDVCDRLWFLTDVKPVQNIYVPLLTTAFPGEVIDNFHVCATCRASLMKNKLPSLCRSYGYTYPPKPHALPKLNQVSERLISPRIPFMSLCRLMHRGGQCGIVGPVVNVPVDVNTMITPLPHNVDEDYCMNVHLKRRLLNRTTYVSGAVKKSEVYQWLAFLCKSTLCKYYNVKVNAVDVQDEIQEDIPDNVIEDLQEDVRWDDPIDSSLALLSYQYTLVWDNENVLAIAPGERNNPLSILFDEHAEEPSFPQIYLLEPRRVDPAAQPIPFTFATSEIRRSDL